ncbi:MAG: NAD(P)H-hydrate dehydratase [Phycisphaeraceae bacterium]|nr:NAD(P)H-hydrate dehydratase [Phycisphaeraceae bacterium]
MPQPEAILIPRLPQRAPDAHKGTFGTVAVVGGCAGADLRMIGAPALAALAALRAGSGLAKIVAPAPILDATLQIAPVATGIPIPVDPRGMILPHEAAAAIDRAASECTCLAVGPGMGRGDGPRAAALRAVQQDRVPVVVDADALNALSEIPQLTRDLTAPTVITPHPGEFRRLAKGMGMNDAMGLDTSRERAAEQMAQRLACVVVLKGHHTVVSDGARTWINSTGNPALATGGSGDVLTGLLAAMIAQFVPAPASLPTRVPTPRPPDRPLDLFQAAALAVHIHGDAADLWRTDSNASGGMLATDLLTHLPAAVQRQRS